MIEMDITMRRQGAALDGRANMLMRRYLRDVEDAVAEYALDLVMFYLQASLKTQTPYYRTRIHIDRTGGDPRVTDGGVIYGPWLEGVGSRNYPTTRFRGYATFRRVAGVVDRDAEDIADRVWRQRYARHF
jgi:hypothetical protein